MADLMKHSHSVIDVSVRIHDAITGSGDGIPTDEAHELVRWLHWRINYAWDLPHSASSIGYDMAVKMLAMAALDLAFHPERGIVDVDAFLRTPLQAVVV